MYIISNEDCLAYHRPGHPESPQRVARTQALLRAQTDVALTWSAPPAGDEEAIRSVHPATHVSGLTRASDFDTDTPALPGIAQRAKDAVGGALAALDLALAGERALSLLRPPGHHARAEQAMGFCYLNQVAVAAVKAAREGRRVAVYDFDVHHGNGTEELLAGREACAYFSVHQHPAYPGTGAAHHGNARNYPMPPETPRRDYVDALRRAFDDMIAFRPDVIAVSAGFDAFRGDPLAQERVEGEDYEELGRALGACGVPCFGVLEGGYSDELPQLVLAFLKGWEEGAGVSR